MRRRNTPEVRRCCNGSIGTQGGALLGEIYYDSEGG